MPQHGKLIIQHDFEPARYGQDDLAVKHGIQRNFARRARSYDRHACMQRLMAQGLVAMVQEALSRARHILEIGCGTGYFTQLLRQSNKKALLVALDLDACLVEAARRRLGADAGVTWLVADGENLIDGIYDLILSNATFQWFTRPAETMTAYWRSLSCSGTLAFSTLGPGTFQELAQALAQAAGDLHISTPLKIPAQDFIDRETWSDLLSQAGFQKIQVTREVVATTYPSVPEFLKALQATGATNPRPSPFSPRLLAAMIASYEAIFENSGRIPVSYEMLWAVAQK